MSFGADVLAFANKAQTRMDLVVRKVTFDMLKDLVLMTPVDTGHARSNYFLGADRITSEDPSAEKNGAPSLSRGSDFVKSLKAGGTFYIVNNVVYIMALEYGHSKQAPAGMARITVARWQQIVNQAVGGLA